MIRGVKMTTNTTQENRRQTGLRLPYLLFVGVLAATLLLLTVPGIREYIRSDILQVQSISLPQVPVVTQAEMYIIVQGWDGQNSVLAIDPNSGEVNRRFKAGYNTAAKLTDDRNILYIYEQSDIAAWPDLFVTGITSAVDTRTGAVLWQTDIPGSLFGSPTSGAWLSTDEQRLYLQGNPGIGLNPHIFVVETRTGILLHDFELPLPYPSNMDQAFPLLWNLPWDDETLIVASRDQLFTFDLTSGQTSDAIPLFGTGSIQRVPLNLPHTTYIHSGAVDPEARQLFLATSTQEILAVDLNIWPFTVRPVTALPTGWQFTVLQPFLYNPADKAVYVQVKRLDTPIINGLEAEEVWVYDTTTWAQQSRLNLQEQLSKVPSDLIDSSIGLDLTNYGLALSPDGQTVFSVNRRGLLEITKDTRSRLQGTWLNIQGENPNSFALKFVVP